MNGKFCNELKLSILAIARKPRTCLNVKLYTFAHTVIQQQNPRQLNVHQDVFRICSWQNSVTQKA